MTNKKYCNAKFEFISDFAIEICTIEKDEYLQENK